MGYTYNLISKSKFYIDLAFFVWNQIALFSFIDYSWYLKKLLFKLFYITIKF